MLKTFKIPASLYLLFSLAACSNQTQSSVEPKGAAKLTEEKTEIVSREKATQKTGCAEINFPQNLQYLNQVKCMSYPVRSEDVLDANTKKLKNGQYDLRGVQFSDSTYFFHSYSENQEDWKVVAKYPLNKEITTFILMSNVGMEGEGYAQTFNLYSVNNNTAKVVPFTLNYVAIDQRIYDFEFEENKNTIYYLQDQPEKSKCVVHFEVSYPNFLKKTRTCWDKKGKIKIGPDDRIFDIKYDGSEIEYNERY